MRDWILLGFMILAGCVFHQDKTSLQDDIPPLEKLTLNYPTVERYVINRSCVRCHLADKGPHHPSLSGYAAIAALVVPGAPEKSDLYLSLKANGGTMPKEGPELSPKQLNLLRAWILAGASETGASPGRPPDEQSPPVEPPPSEDPIEPTLTALREKVFAVYCADCHKGADSEGGVDLWSYQAMLHNDLHDVVIPFDANKSDLYRDVVTKDMPRPLKRGWPARVLPQAAITAIRQWIENGAADN